MRQQIGRRKVRSWAAAAVPAAALIAALFAPVAEAEVIKPREVTPNVVRPTPVPSAPQVPSAAPARGPVATPASPTAPAPASTPAPTRTPAPVSQGPARKPGHGVDDLPSPTTRDCDLGCQQQWYSRYAKESDPWVNEFLGQIARNVSQLASDTGACRLVCQRAVYRQFEDVRARKAKRGEKDPDVEKVLKGLEMNMDKLGGDGPEWGTPVPHAPRVGAAALNDKDDDFLGIPEFLEDFAGLAGVEDALKEIANALFGGSNAICAQPKLDGDGNAYCPK